MIIDFNNKGTPEQMVRSLQQSVQMALSAYGAVGSQIIDRIYPVGTVYMSIKPTNPSELFGGEWEDVSSTGIIDEVAPPTKQIFMWARVR